MWTRTGRPLLLSSPVPSLTANVQTATTNDSTTQQLNDSMTRQTDYTSTTCQSRQCQNTKYLVYLVYLAQHGLDAIKLWTALSTQVPTMGTQASSVDPCPTHVVPLFMFNLVENLADPNKLWNTIFDVFQPIESRYEVTPKYCGKLVHHVCLSASFTPLGQNSCLNICVRYANFCRTICNMHNLGLTLISCFVQQNLHVMQACINSGQIWGLPMTSTSVLPCPTMSLRLLANVNDLVVFSWAPGRDHTSITCIWWLLYGSNTNFHPSKGLLPIHLCTTGVISAGWSMHSATFRHFLPMGSCEWVN